MNGKNGLILWLLGGVGFLFVYAAYKNQTPQSILLNHLGETVTPTPIATLPGAALKPGDTRPDGSIVTDPKTPDQSPKSAPTVNGNALTGYTTRSDVSGQVNVIDANGYIVGAVPTQYANASKSYIPPVGTVNV